MAAENIVTDESLSNLLRKSNLVRDQALQLLETVEQHLNSSIAYETSPSFQLELSKRQQRLHASLAHLRGSNRNAIFDVRRTKQATAEARSEVDRLHLHLQNLYYEQRHLRGEIAACESYECVIAAPFELRPLTKPSHKYTHLPLIPVEEFFRTHPELPTTDEDALMVERIQHEHRERLALEEKRQVLLKQKQSLVADNNKRKEDLASLDKDLEEFINAAKPIQEIFEKKH